MNAAIERTGKSRWTNFVAEELVKDVETRFPVMREPKARLLAGISMGGHGALQIALNRPGIFGFVAAHSPVLRAVNNLEGLHDQFGTGADYEQRDPLSLIRRKGQIFFEGLWLDIGRGDFSYERTWEFANELRARFDHHQLWIDNTSSDGHDLSYWKRRLPEYLGWYQQVLTKPSLRAPTKPF
jgi:S-formylglutathione hydrolase FrmB